MKRVRDGRLGTFAVAVMVAAGASVFAAVPAAASGPAVIDQVLSSNENGVATIDSPPVSTAVAGKTVVALVAADGPRDARQNLSVSGCGLRWRGAGGEVLTNIANNQAGAVAVYYATTTAPLAECAVRGSLIRPGYAAMITVAVVSGAANTLTFSSASGSSGAAVSTVTVPQGALVLGVGNDWDAAIARTPLPGQEIVHEAVNTDVGDTFWVQRLSGPAEQQGPVTIGTSAPTDDQWNFVTVTVPAAS